MKIETKAGERIGQFGYRVIDSAARRADPYEVAGNQVLQYCNLALNLKLSERGGSVRIISAPFYSVSAVPDGSASGLKALAGRCGITTHRTTYGTVGSKQNSFQAIAEARVFSARN